MIHYGDITKIKGSDVPVVDIITGGSPCQDLSVAGLRKGLLHSNLGDGETTRSGLFMEQIRIIKEMRDENKRRLEKLGRTDEYIRPRYMVWENVPGAFSSNGGEDFHAVLEETAKVADENAVIPRFEGGRWSASGCIMGNGWSIAWRVHDAQFWGVPQRRKRIALVADFGGATAPEILFERKGVSRDIESCEKEGQGIAGTVDGSVGEAGENIGFDAYNQAVTGDVTMPLRNKAADNDHIPLVVQSAELQKDRSNIVYGLDRASFNQGQNAQYDFSVEEELAQTLVAKGPGGVLAKQ